MVQSPPPRARVRHTSKGIPPPPSLSFPPPPLRFRLHHPFLLGALPSAAAEEEEMAERLTRIAIVSEDKCKPKKCRQECKKSCPVVKTGRMIPPSVSSAIWSLGLDPEGSPLPPGSPFERGESGAWTGAGRFVAACKIRGIGRRLRAETSIFSAVEIWLGPVVS